VEIRAAAARAAELTRQLLAVSSRQVLRPVVLDLNELLAQTRPFLQRAIGDGIALRISTCEESAKVRADPAQLERVLLNLAVNARDAMSAGGTLTLCTSVDASLRAVVLSVQDTGSGMSDHTLHHLFEPFFTTKERGKGTGLGLATVYGIVQQSGGTVAAQSELGKGSRFTLSLPCAEPAEASPSATAAEPQPPKGGNGTVLVVEDEAAVRKLVTRVLRGAGYEVLEAFGGAVAVQLARNHPGQIHLIVVDVVMPGMNGRETAEAIAKVRPGIPALFISGYTDEIIARHGVLEAGVQLLAKPFTSRELLGRVQQLLHAAEPSARLA
jgi:CheY-like chemotaxis protein